MFCIQIAGIPIGIDNRYPGVKRLCSDYIVEKQPLFTVSVPKKICSKNRVAISSFRCSIVKASASTVKSV